MEGITSIISIHQDELIKNVKKYFEDFFHISKKSIEGSLACINSRLLIFLRKDVSFLVEYPYVDKLYRNSYYNYYSCKNYNYNRNTIRVSIFDKELTSDNLYNNEFLKENYLGFFVIRPTFSSVLGRNVINPKAFLDSKFSICSSIFDVTTNSLKTQIEGFPHSSQDTESITCAETTIWSIVEYFSNKYNEYTPLLPSDIHKMLYDRTFERQLPSKGLRADQISYALKKVGFGVKIYNRNLFPDEFENILKIYIESGIPIVAAVYGSKIGHAFNIIGRRNIDIQDVLQTQPISLRQGSLLVRDISDVPNEFVFVDDNYAPYRIGDLSNPCSHYKNTDWDDVKIMDIIVPLYSKIHMGAGEARRFTRDFLELSSFAYNNKEICVKTFLCSSRSYKDYIVNLDNINLDVKKLFLTLPMPKFIWVSEISYIEEFSNNLISGVILLDATEPKSIHIIGSIVDNIFIIKNISDNLQLQLHSEFKNIVSFNYNLKYYG